MLLKWFGWCVFFSSLLMLGMLMLVVNVMLNGYIDLIVGSYSML